MAAVVVTRAAATGRGSASMRAVIRDRHGWSGTWFLLVTWCLVSVGDALREGEFTPYGLSLVVIGTLLLAGALALRLEVTIPTRRQLVLPVVVSVVCAAAIPGYRYMHVPGHGLIPIHVLALVTAALALSLLAVPRHAARLWWGVVALAVATGITTVVLASDPHIDVWFLLQQSSSGLLQGKDMYRQHWVHSTGLQAVYPYLPITTILLAPFRWLLGDVRYGLLLALVLVAFVLRRIAPSASPALAGLALVFPHMAFIVDQSWTEPMLVLALAVTVLAIVRGHTGWAIVALAVAMACKQPVALLFPLFAVWPQFGLRRTVKAAVLALVLVSPWLVAGPSAMWHDVVHANLALPVLRRALCLPSLFDRWGFVAGFWFLVLLLVASYALIGWRARRSPAGLAASAALLILVYDLANKQSFFNHYQLATGLVLVALAAAVPTAPTTRTAEQPTRPKAALA